MEAFKREKRMTGRCTVDIRNVQTEVSFMENSTGAVVVGRTRIFEKHIGEAKIVCPAEPFSLVGAHHELGRRLYETGTNIEMPTKVLAHRRKALLIPVLTKA
jgi:hypothetical protein